jgi:hypothetical protein
MHTRHTRDQLAEVDISSRTNADALVTNVNTSAAANGNNSFSIHAAVAAALPDSHSPAGSIPYFNVPKRTVISNQNDYTAIMDPVQSASYERQQRIAHTVHAGALQSKSVALTHRRRRNTNAVAAAVPTENGEIVSLTTPPSMVASCTPSPRRLNVSALAAERIRLDASTNAWMRAHEASDAPGPLINAKASHEWKEAISPRTIGHHQHQQPQSNPSSISPYRPSRHATISPAIFSNSPFAPKVAGQSLAPTPRGGPLSPQRAIQMEREVRMAEAARIRKHEPLFVPPMITAPTASASPAIAARNALKPPLAVHVASSSFCFYTTAEDAPIQLEFPQQPIPYPPALYYKPTQLHQQTTVISPTSTSPRQKSQQQSQQQQTATIHTTNSLTHSITNAEQHQLNHHSYPHSHFSYQQQYTQQLSQDDHPQYQLLQLDPGGTLDSAAGDMLRVAGVHSSTHGADINHPDGTYRAVLPPHQHQSHHFHASLPGSPTPYTGMRSHGYSHTSHPPPTQASVIINPHASVTNHSTIMPSLGSLSASMLRHSGHLDSLQSETRPVFPSYHQKKSTITRKKAGVDEEVHKHALQHLQQQHPRTNKVV